MNILLANDDGVHAPGINILRKELQSLGRVIVVAPLEERSTTGHTLSLDIPLRIVEIEKDVYGCSGFPADCSMMAIGHLIKDLAIDVMVSGINRGANLAQDIYYSGTVAAAREACFHGLKTIAVSSTISMHRPDLQSSRHYETAAQFVKKLLQNKFYQELAPFEMLNVNVPNIPSEAVKGVKVTSLGFRQYSPDISERVDCRHRKYFWIGGLYQGNLKLEGSDTEAIENHFISITPLNLLGNSPDGIMKWKNIFSGKENLFS